MQYEAIIVGLPALARYKNLSEEIKNVASLSINKTAIESRDSAALRIQQQVAFPAQYLDGSRKRLSVSRFSTPARLEARIRGRARPTSLATFSRSTSVRKAGVTVQVKPGQARRLKRAFLIRLPQGKQLTETKFNLGLAVRLKPGEKIENKRRMVAFGGGLYLLYGPSVNQIFDDVAVEMTDEIYRTFDDDFFRRLNL